MKILAFTDPHGQTHAAGCVACLSAVHSPDFVACAGDVTDFGRVESGFLETLRSIRKTVFFVPGNHDSTDTVRLLAARNPFLKDITYSTADHFGIQVIGLPGTAKFWPGARPDPETVQSILNFWGALDRRRPVILLTHYPPSGTPLDGMDRMSPDAGGSPLVREIIRVVAPTLVICGHYHPEAGKSCRLGPVELVNPGPCGKILTFTGEPFQSPGGAA